MATTYPEVWDLDVFFEGGSESPAFQQFINNLPQQVEVLIGQTKSLTTEVSADELRHTIDQLKELMEQIMHAGGMLSCLTAQNTKDVKALQLQGQLSAISASYSPAVLRLQQLLAEIDEARFS